MTAHRDPDHLITAFLNEGVNELPDRAYEAVRAATEQTRQRVVLGPWRENQMTKYAMFAAAAAVVVLAVVFGLRFLPGNDGIGFGGPGTATPSQSPATPPEASPTAEPSPSAEPSPTAQPSPTGEPAATRRPTSTPDAGLPEGPFTLTQLTAGAPTVTVAIPAPGWRSLPEFEAIQKGIEVANLPEAAILFWAFVAGTEFYVPEDPCQGRSTRPDEPATSVDEIVTALAAQASRNASEPENVTVGGYEGKSITVHVPDDVDPDECELGEFVSYGTANDPLQRNHQGPGQIDELWILDLDGAIFIINGMYRSDTPAELVEEMRTVAESATFEAP